VYNHAIPSAPLNLTLAKLKKQVAIGNADINVWLSRLLRCARNEVARLE